MWLEIAIASFISALLTSGIFLILDRLRIIKAKERAEAIINSAVEEKENLINLAYKEAEELKNKFLSSAKEEINSYRNDVEKDLRNIRRDLQMLEKRLSSKEELLERKEVYLQRREKEISIKEKEIKDLESQVLSLKEKINQDLQRIASMTEEEARNLLLESIKKEVEISSLEVVSKIENEYKQIANEKARKILIDAIQRIALDVVNDNVVSTVNLPNDDMKGRIIGREGRNIRAFEMITGVDVIIDDTPNVVVLSSFDPLRREIAARTLNKLLEDGRIHPTTIEEVFERVTKDFENELYKIGEETYLKLGIQPMSNDEYRYVGKMKFKHSYSQNVLHHSIEVAIIAERIAEELGLDSLTINNAKKSGLLHDIGKVYENAEGGHAIVGANLAKSWGYSDRIVNAIASHHGEVEPLYIEASILAVADAISAARPGARKENIENYIKRLENLERIATSMPNVEKAYAIQAGRELRVFVDSEKVSDEEAKLMAKNIAKRIYEEISFPGQIKVTLIRETRIVETVR
ncbi:MAG: ribonuclease Y [Spirochaetia bacterium]|nr:ribonuclease Y [Spirochaetota bacterium]MDW8112885.1 ribonuclease Y [Spirochaetia bacterium]